MVPRGNPKKGIFRPPKLSFSRFSLSSSLSLLRDRKGTPKNFCDKDFAELSGELSGETWLKTLVLLGCALELFRKRFGAARAFFWLWGSFLALELQRFIENGSEEKGLSLKEQQESVNAVFCKHLCRKRKSDKTSGCRTPKRFRARQIRIIIRYTGRRVKQVQCGTLAF